MAPFKARSPILDGQIGPDEYGSPLYIEFTRDANPGRLISGTVQNPEDLSYHVFAAHDNQALYVAVRVRDDVLVVNDADARNPWRNDAVQIFLDGDLAPGDFLQRAQDPRYSREGFEVIADIAGHRKTFCDDFPDEAWSAVTRKFDDGRGYVTEFRIPMVLIDTKDGRAFERPEVGSTVGWSLLVTDRDAPEELGAVSALWHDGARGAWHWAGGDASWKARLRFGGAEFHAPYRQKAPNLDARIDPGEYGPPAILDFADASPLGALLEGKLVGPDDLSAEVSFCYTETDLFVAVKARDDVVVGAAAAPAVRDRIDLGIDGDLRPGDFGPSSPGGSREGFFLRAEVRGERTGSGPWTSNWGWTSASAQTADGYVVEFRVPLSMIDTRNGPGEARPGPGSAVRIGLVIGDRDSADPSEPLTRGSLWKVPGLGETQDTSDTAWVCELQFDRPSDFELAGAAVGLRIDPDSGLLSWTPAPGESARTITIRARDRKRSEVVGDRDFTLFPDGMVIPRPVEPFERLKLPWPLPPSLR